MRKEELDRLSLLETAVNNLYEMIRDIEDRLPDKPAVSTDERSFIGM